ncbi:APC family permease [Fructilactobacillus florum]|uniref:Amino acid permease-associated protein n=1 Tax=Fructilactobacillus florum DSM 22689 = JCM 16035 TaxID=1423745 RepID=A0A0R2CFL4_9LACO|nr:amino acid permease [Fructilactobacillus florum]KRM90526.1 amino acid permease-associated protein [Fructilactobacillus florum DSM 22689 = JCM 16035]
MKSPENSEQVELNRSLGLWSALSLVIGTIIGVGIFVRQAAVINEAGSAKAALLAWLAGGLLTLAAGLTIAEIASQNPSTGGLYAYMEQIYNQFWGFLSGWMQIIVYGPAMIAALGSYLAVLVGDFFNTAPIWHLPIALGSVCLVGILNMFPNRYGGAFAIITTICKLVPVAALIIFGLFFGRADAFSSSIQGLQTTAGGFGVAMLATLFAFDGWILVANLGGEIKNPRKMLPRAITLGILTVMGIYLLVSYGVLKSIGAQKVHDLGTAAIPYIAQKDFGQIGGKILSIGIIISIIGCMNGKIMTFPRIMYAMAKQDQLPWSKKLAYLNRKTRTPIFSIIAVIVIAGLMIVLTNPDRISELCIFTIYCFYVMAFVGLFLLRRRNPNQPRVFSVPLFPLTPLLAIAGSLFVIGSEILSDPIGVIVSLSIVAVGCPVYYFKVMRKHHN